MNPKQSQSNGKQSAGIDESAIEMDEPFVDCAEICQQSPSKIRKRQKKERAGGLH